MLWSDIAVALGFVLVIEGLFYALFPGTARRVMTLGLAQPQKTLVLWGVIAAGSGLMIVWFIRG